MTEIQRVVTRLLLTGTAMASFATGESAMELSATDESWSMLTSAPVPRRDSSWAPAQ